MVSSFIDSFRYNFIFQAIARVVSFCITIYLLRHIDPSLLGIFNVRNLTSYSINHRVKVRTVVCMYMLGMNVLYTTIGFLTREPFRRTCLSSDMNLTEIMKYAWLSPIACILWCIVCSFSWLLFTTPPLEIESSYFAIVGSFTISALIEGLTEPFVILCMKLGENAQFAIGQSMLVFLQKFFVLVLILSFNVDPILAFCVSQIAASLFYFLFYIWKMFYISFNGSLIPSLSDYDWNHIEIVRSITVHSVMKQLLTEGAGFVMSFTNLLTLKQQAVYDAVERLGSLVARIILAPLEESATNYFQANLKRDGKISKIELANVINTFVSLLRQVFISGLVICVFSIPYSKLAVTIYGGSLLVENQGAQMLMLYAIYLVIIAINGITECFAFSSMNNSQINSHRNFLFKSGLGHLALNLTLPIFMGPFGFILGKCIDMSIRINYSYNHIVKYLNNYAPSINSIMPSLNLVIMLGFSFFVTTISSLLFGTTQGYIHTGAHLAVGGTMFLLISWHLYFTEQLFSQKVHKRIE